MSAERYSLGGFWGPRKESVDDCARRAAECFRRLALCDECFGHWVKPGTLRRKPGTEFEPTFDGMREILAKRRNRSEVTGSVIEDLGFPGFLSNGSGDNRVYISFTFGAYSEKKKRTQLVLRNVKRKRGRKLATTTMAQAPACRLPSPTARVNAVESCDATSQYCTQTDYDDAGRATLVTDRAHHPTRTDYDDAGRPKKVTYADSNFTQTGYDAQGRRQSQTDELGHTTTFMYDTVGRLQGVIQPAVPDPERGGQSFMPTTNYEYDVFGNVKKIRDAKGRESWFAYDEYNRQVRRSLPPAGPGSEGTSSGGNMPTTLNETRQTWQADQWKGFTVRCRRGNGLLLGADIRSGDGAIHDDGPVC